MTEPSPCCSAFDLCIGASSPFARPVPVILEWYDGLVEGMAVCTACGRVWHFKMLNEDDGQWFRSEGRRVFSLAPVERADYEMLVRLMPPNHVWQFDDARKQAETWSEVDAIVARAGSVQWIVAADSVLEHVIAAKKCDGLPECADWLGYLGIK